jgi:hypothetical protein
MKYAAGLVLGGLLAASMGASTTYFALQIRGGSRVWALDRPVLKGRVYLFHRFPDGIYMSLAAGEVEKVVGQAEPPQPEGLAPGQTVFVGPPLSGPGAVVAVVPTAPPSDTMTYDSGYGYYGYDWGWGGYVPPSRPPGLVPPSRIGPNGFPIIAPPGSAGSTPLPIGPKGFPILAPQPPSPQPRRQ